MISGASMIMSEQDVSEGVMHGFGNNKKARAARGVEITVTDVSSHVCRFFAWLL